MEKIEWPEGKKFAVCLSHDVDRVRKTYQFLTHFIVERRFYHLISILQKPNPYWQFERIMELEKKYDVRSTFFFLKETKKFELFKPSTYILSLGHYDFKNPEVKKIIKKLDSNGWEIGLHGSYDSYKDKKLMQQEKQELENVVDKSIIGIRQHYLNLDIPQSWEIQKEIGFKYDATFGYRDKIGFRDEKIIPFKPFNDNFLVIPLNVMDGVVFSIYDNDTIRWEKIQELINLTERKGGLITFLWHQRVFNEKDFPGWASMYEKVIKECQDRKAWIVPCEKIYSYLSNISK
jgi:peptidoglycan/xylan/chitin deacetylase (PgdA/CDA1 family)